MHTALRIRAEVATAGSPQLSYVVCEPNKKTLSLWKCEFVRNWPWSRIFHNSAGFFRNRPVKSWQFGHFRWETLKHFLGRKRPTDDSVRHSRLQAQLSMQSDIRQHSRLQPAACQIGGRCWVIDIWYPWKTFERTERINSKCGPVNSRCWFWIREQRYIKQSVRITYKMSQAYFHECSLNGHT